MLRLALLVVLVWGMSVASATAQGRFRGAVQRVTDGDTYRVLREDGRLVDVRLWGVDAPERGQPYGRAAAEAARRLVGGKTIRVSVEATDEYGRLLSRVEVEGRDVARELVRQGLAWRVEGQARGNRSLARLQQEARSAGQGLWAQPDPTPPWEWRRQQRRPGVNTAPPVPPERGP